MVIETVSDQSNVPVVSKVHEIAGLIVGVTSDGNLITLARVMHQPVKQVKVESGNGATMPKKRGRKPKVRPEMMPAALAQPMASA